MANLVRTGIASLVLLATLASPLVASAQLTADQEDQFGIDSARQVGLGEQDLKATIVGVVQTIMGFLGLLAVIVVIWGGVKWMTSGGEQAKVDEARKLIINGVIGLVIVILAFTIVTFVLGELLDATGASDSSL
jgi:Trk-type K+ transport system membrane component